MMGLSVVVEAWGDRLAGVSSRPPAGLCLDWAQEAGQLVGMDRHDEAVLVLLRLFLALLHQPWQGGVSVRFLMRLPRARVGASAPARGPDLLIEAHRRRRPDEPHRPGLLIRL